MIYSMFALATRFCEDAILLFVFRWRHACSVYRQLDIVSSLMSCEPSEDTYVSQESLFISKVIIFSGLKTEPTVLSNECDKSMLYILAQPYSVSYKELLLQCSCLWLSCLPACLLTCHTHLSSHRLSPRPSGQCADF